MAISELRGTKQNELLWGEKSMPDTMGTWEETKDDNLSTMEFRFTKKKREIGGGTWQRKNRIA